MWMISVVGVERAARSQPNQPTHTSPIQPTNRSTHEPDRNVMNSRPTTTDQLLLRTDCSDRTGLSAGSHGSDNPAVVRLEPHLVQRAFGRQVSWVKMVWVDTYRTNPTPVDEVNESDRAASMARLNDLFSDGTMSHEHFSEVLEQVFAAPNRADLEAAMLVLPPLVRPTPASLRLTKPLVLQVADGGLRLGSGWQLAADTTISTGFGATRLDLTAASWDARSDQSPSGDLGLDRGRRSQRSGRAARRRVTPGPASVAVPTRPWWSDVADLHIRANRDDPDPPPRGGQHWAVRPLEATEDELGESLIDAIGRIGFPGDAGRI